METELITLGGPGSGNFGHSGRPGEVGGSSSDREHSEAAAGKALVDSAREMGNRWPAPTTKEEQKQDLLARAQSNPLARPQFVIGAPGRLNGPAMRYVAAYGEEFKAAPRPDDVEKGPDGQCYANTTWALLQDDTLDYAEGWATSAGTGDLVFMHAWAVTADGTVVDPTWSEPERGEYFGVRYDRTKYLARIYSAKYHGVLGSDHKVAKKVIETGGAGWRP